MIPFSKQAPLFLCEGIASVLGACGSPHEASSTMQVAETISTNMRNNGTEQIIRNWPVFVEALRLPASHASRLPATLKPNLGLGELTGRFNLASGAPGDVQFDLVLGQELGTRGANPANDILDVRMSLADTATQNTLAGRLVLWVPTRITAPGWLPASVPGALGRPVSGSVFSLGNVTASKALTQAAWVPLAAQVQAAMASAPSQTSFTLAFEDSRFANGNIERLKPLQTVKPRAQAFQVPSFDPRHAGQSAFFWAPVGSQLLRQPFVPRTVGKAFYGYRGPFEVSGDLSMPNTGKGFRFAMEGVGIAGLGQDAQSRFPIFGHYAPKRFTVTNTQGGEPAPFKIHSVKATANALLSERTLFQGTLAPGREQPIPVASLEPLTPRDFGVEQPYYHFLVLESGSEQAVIAILAQGFLGDPIGRGFTFPY